MDVDYKKRSDWRCTKSTGSTKYIGDVVLSFNIGDILIQIFVTKYITLPLYLKESVHQDWKQILFVIEYNISSQNTSTMNASDGFCV